MSGPSQEDSATLRRQWFGSVYEIADMEFQRRTWLAPPTPSPHWSYVEFCSCFPDAAQLQYALDRGQLIQPEFDLLVMLGKAIAAHKPPRSDDYDHAAILADPLWQAVVARAEKTRRELLRLVKDPVERNYLSGDKSTP